MKEGILIFFLVWGPITNSRGVGRKYNIRKGPKETNINNGLILPL